MRPFLFAPMFLAVALAGCAADDPLEGAGATIVEVDDDYFEVEGRPATKNDDAEAKVGDTWHFKNGGENAHTVTIHHPPDQANDTLIDEDLGPDDEVDFTFDEPGTYHIWCRYHGKMTSGMAMAVEVTA